MGWRADIYYTMDETSIHKVKWKPSVTKDHILYNFIYTNDQNRQIYKRLKVVLARIVVAMGWAEEVTADGYRVSFEGDRSIIKLTVGMAAQLWIY